MRTKLIPATLIAAVMATPAMASVCANRNEVAEYLESVARELDASVWRHDTDAWFVQSRTDMPLQKRLEFAIREMRNEAGNQLGTAERVRKAVLECQENPQ